MDIVLASTITKLPDDMRGAVLVTGSHGGVYCGWLAAAAAVRGAIFHDAGVGRQRAGIASLATFAPRAFAAASHLTCRIGDADDMMARGRISHANATADGLGITRNMQVAEAVERLKVAPLVLSHLAPLRELRRVLTPEGAARPLVLVDSASLVDPVADRGAIVVTGSHGELIAGNPAAALRTEAFAAVFNDAGRGIDDAGIGRLAALDARGIAAVTVAAASARIGDAGSSLDDGIISATNQGAEDLGASVAMKLRDWIDLLLTKPYTGS